MVKALESTEGVLRPIPLAGVREICVQFSFSNGRAVPVWVAQIERETVSAHKERKKRASGEQLIALPKGSACSLESLPTGLSASDFVLADAYSQKRNKAGKVYDPYWMVRFIFVRKDVYEDRSRYAEVRNLHLRSLEEMISSAFWKVRGFLNPYFRDGELLEGEFQVSINLEHRQPTVNENGSPVLRWPRDEKGRKITSGDKIPFPPTHHLLVGDGKIEAVVE